MTVLDDLGLVSTGKPAGSWVWVQPKIPGVTNAVHYTRGQSNWCEEATVEGRVENAVKKEDDDGDEVSVDSLTVLDYI